MKIVSEKPAPQVSSLSDDEFQDLQTNSLKATSVTVKTQLPFYKVSRPLDLHQIAYDSGGIDSSLQMVSIHRMEQVIDGFLSF